MKSRCTSHVGRRVRYSLLYRNENRRVPGASRRNSRTGEFEVVDRRLQSDTRLTRLLDFTPHDRIIRPVLVLKSPRENSTENATENQESAVESSAGKYLSKTNV